MQLKTDSISVAIHYLPVVQGFKTVIISADFITGYLLDSLQKAPCRRVYIPKKPKTKQNKTEQKPDEYLALLNNNL